MFAEDAQEPARDFDTELLGVPFDLHARIRDRWSVGDRVGHLERERLLLDGVAFLLRGVHELLLLRDPFRFDGLLFFELLQFRFEPLHLNRQRFDIACPLSDEPVVFLLRDEWHEVTLFFLQLDSRPRIARAAEDAVQAVIVFSTDRVELVIVAAGARQRQAKERSPHVVDRVFDGQMLRVVIDPRTESPCESDVAGRDDPPVAVPATIEQVSRELFADELVVRQVTIEGVDHPVAVLDHLRDRIVRVVARRVGVPHNVEPMSSPAFSVMRRLQQTINDFGKGRRRVGRIVDEGVHFVGSWRETDQIEGGSTDERSPCRIARRREALCFLSGSDVTVHIIERPLRIAHGRDRRIDNGRKGPACASLGDIEDLSRNERRRGARIRRTHRDPFREIADLVVAQSLLRGHFQIGVRVIDGGHQQAALRIARHENGTAVASLHNPRSRVEQQPASQFLRRRAVAFVTPLDQQRPDALLEEHELLVGGSVCKFGRLGLRDRPVSRPDFNPRKVRRATSRRERDRSASRVGLPWSELLPLTGRPAVESPEYGSFVEQYVEGLGVVVLPNIEEDLMWSRREACQSHVDLIPPTTAPNHLGSFNVRRRFENDGLAVEGFAVAGVIARVFALPLLFVDDDCGAI